MSLNTLDIKLTPRKEVTKYRLQINQSTLDILSLLFEFKMATSWQITRFQAGRDVSKYIYRKLRRMWNAKLIDSFKVFTGSIAGMPVYYVLSKTGLQTLLDHGVYEASQLRRYPKIKTIFTWGLFSHESQIVELASLEVKNKSKQLDIACKGETSSQSYKFYSDKNIEVLTPDYTVLYKTDDKENYVYTEFERTTKSKASIIQKVERYLNYLSPEQRKNTTLRFIFQTESMEQGFWLTLLLNKPAYPEKIRILSTNVSLLDDYKQFLQPIYVSPRTLKLVKDPKLKVDTSKRTQLFPFL